MDWFNVVTQSEEYGTESFKYVTLSDALDGIARLYTKCLGDGVERVIGLVVNAENDADKPDTDN